VKNFCPLACRKKKTILGKMLKNKEKRIQLRTVKECGRNDV
jgi:hypothetical protein